MKTSEDKKKFLKTLEEKPFITYACKKSGISKSTIYRWMDNPKFKAKVDRAIRPGRDELVDMAEVKLIELIKEGDIRAIRFYLEHNSPRYRPLRTTYLDPEKNKDKDPHINLREGETCPSCGYKKEYKIPEERKNRIIQAFDNFGLVKHEND